jgi:hypothetical protein
MNVYTYDNSSVCEGEFITQSISQLCAVTTSPYAPQQQPAITDDYSSDVFNNDSTPEPTEAPSLIPSWGRQGYSFETCRKYDGYIGQPPTAPTTSAPTAMPTERSTMLVYVSIGFTLDHVLTKAVLNESIVNDAMAKFVCDLLVLPVEECECGEGCLSVTEFVMEDDTIHDDVIVDSNNTVVNATNMASTFFQSPRFLNTWQQWMNKDDIKDDIASGSVIASSHLRGFETKDKDESDGSDRSSSTIHELYYNTDDNIPNYLLSVKVNATLNAIDFTHPDNITLIMYELQSSLSVSEIVLGSPYESLFWGLFFMRDDLFQTYETSIQEDTLKVTLLSVNVPHIIESIAVSPTLMPTQNPSSLSEAIRDEGLSAKERLTTAEIAGIVISLSVLLFFQCFAMFVCCCNQQQQQQQRSVSDEDTTTENTQQTWTLFSAYHTFIQFGVVARCRRHARVAVTDND